MWVGEESKEWIVVGSELTSNNEKPKRDERRKKNLVIAYSTFVITFILHLIWTKHDLDFGINNYHLKIIKKRLARCEIIIYI